MTLRLAPHGWQLVALCFEKLAQGEPSGTPRWTGQAVWLDAQRETVVIDCKHRKHHKPDEVERCLLARQRRGSWRHTRDRLDPY